jgi:hypothetical protein
LPESPDRLRQGFRESAEALVQAAELPEFRSHSFQIPVQMAHWDPEHPYRVCR